MNFTRMFGRRALLACSLGVVATPLRSAEAAETVATSAVPRDVFYSVSPGMPYSTLGLPMAQAAARQSNLKLRVLGDPNASKAELDVLEASLGTRVERDIPDELVRSGYLNHFPATQVAGSHAVLFGYKTQSRLETFLRGTGIQLSKTQLTDDDGAGYAAPPDDLDRSSELRTESMSLFPIKPKYFVRPFFDSPWLPFTTQFANHLWLTTSGSSPRALKSLPHLVDPVPTPDDRFVTIPVNYLPPGLNALVFYSVDRSTGEHTEVFRDGKMAGAYQSVAVLGETATQVRYRVVSEATLIKGLLRTQDYVVTKPDAAKGTGYVFARVHRKNIRLCKSEDISLPMLSKDGRHLAAVDASSRVMQVFDLDDDGNCSAGRSLGFISGKVDFSPDGRKLLFHRSLPDARSVAKVVTNPDKRWQVDIFEYDFDSAKVSRLTHCGEGAKPANCYYPNHLSGGRIGYLRQNKVGEGYWWVTAQRTPSEL